MSQYFTYGNLKGTVPIDVYTTDPSCKTCGLSKCYNTYDKIQGVSISTHAPFISSILDETNKMPMFPVACDPYMLKCPGADITTNDPYNITTKTIGTCNPADPKYYNIKIPQQPISLDKNRRRRHIRSERDSSFNAGIIKPAYDTGLSSISVKNFDYIDERPVSISSVHSERYKPFESVISYDYLKDDKSETKQSKSVQGLFKIPSVSTTPTVSTKFPSVSVSTTPSVSTKFPSISVSTTPSVSVPNIIGSKPSLSTPTGVRIPIVKSFI